ncbi:hypothetical protein C8256_22340 [Kluyvera genomosp. 2]|uniref:Uncharacterized protein n=1 Tax=Kluyvera genomosp. 2 TaxID=2774054 RepID=A0A2T2XWD7_9ENTR|nr:hypothetical protein C8256_22340 [Kluyvera genomosp. 2]
MPDGANAYPAYSFSSIVGRIRCLHRHPAFSLLIINFPTVNRFSVARFLEPMPRWWYLLALFKKY